MSFFYNNIKDMKLNNGSMKKILFFSEKTVDRVDLFC